MALSNCWLIKYRCCGKTVYRKNPPVFLNFSSSVTLPRFLWKLVGSSLPLHHRQYFWFVKLPFLFVLDAKVSKDDRSDIESSSDEEIYSNGSKNATQTLKTKDGGHTGNLNGDTHEHWVLPGKIYSCDAVTYLVYACVTLSEDAFEKLLTFFFFPYSEKTCWVVCTETNSHSICGI